jgi:hypothetical protein
MANPIFSSEQEASDWRNGLWYLAMPYSHPDPAVVQSRMDIFQQVDGNLLRCAFFTVSPLAKHFGLSISNLPGDWAYWQHYSRAMLDKCYGMFVITVDGWKESTGVQGEIEYATSLGIEIKYLDQFGNPVDPDTL